MNYRKLRADETTIQVGDVIAREFHPMASGESVQDRAGGTAFVLRPIPDESEDVVRVEGEVCDILRCCGVIDQVNVTLARTSVPFDVTIGHRVALLISCPEPPVPKCLYCGMEMAIEYNDAGYWAECRYSNCAVAVNGPCRPSRREAIKAMTPKGGGQ